MYSAKDYDEIMQSDKAKVCYFCDKKYDIPVSWTCQTTPETEQLEEEDSSDTDSDDDNDTASEQGAKEIPA